MNKSESIAELLKALSVFQGDLANAGVNKQGHGYKYATLANCIDSAKDGLVKNGLSVIQLISNDDAGNNTCETIVGHSSGEYISTTCIIPIAKLAGGGANNPAQVMGASITYIRRYQYAAAIGLCQADDDAASATKGSPQNDTNWYNGLNQDRGNMIAALQQGSTHQSIIDNLKGQGFALSKKTQQEIMELTV